MILLSNKRVSIRTEEVIFTQIVWDGRGRIVRQFMNVSVRDPWSGRLELKLLVYSFRDI